MAETDLCRINGTGREDRGLQGFQVVFQMLKMAQDVSADWVWKQCIAPLPQLLLWRQGGRTDKASMVG